MERVVLLRCADGLPGLAIQWGAVKDVGMLADKVTDCDQEVIIEGTIPQRISSCFDILGLLLSNPSHAVYSYFVRANTMNANQNNDEDILQAISKIIGVNNLFELDSKKVLAEIGMDSLMAVEIRQLLESRCNLHLALKDLRTVIVSQS